ncbi:MAG: di-heme enzyme [Holophagales bacterium]|nr:di-heme enzyme [Holophagales bacterium]
MTLGLLLLLGAGVMSGAESGPDEAGTVPASSAAGSVTGMEGATSPTYVWELPEGLPVPRVPADNPMSDAKVELGRRLFYDPRLSADGTMSCATCHRQELAFTDGRARALGVTGEIHPRSSMSLANVAYSATLTWDDPRLERLEEQLRTPLFGHDPVEMGAPRSGELERRLAQDRLYRLLFRAAFDPVAPTEPKGSTEPAALLEDAPFAEASSITVENLAKAIAAFERTLISGNSPFDGWLRGEPGALSPSQRRGLRLFFSNRLSCGACHRGFNLSGPIRFEGSRDNAGEHHNTGLYNLGDGGAYPPDNPGVFRHTGRSEDMGRFRAPTLRNIAVTAPYMHDGSIPDLDGVIDHYAAGGRTVASGPFAGAGHENPWKSQAVPGFPLTPGERADLLAFLRSLTDRAFLTDPRFADPWLQSAALPLAERPSP